MEDSKKMTGAEILSAPLFKKIHKTHPKLYGRFYGNFFRSTMDLGTKISFLESFLARGDLTKLPSLIQTLKDNYNIEEIPRRNKEWMEFYNF